MLYSYCRNLLYTKPKLNIAVLDKTFTTCYLQFAHFPLFKSYSQRIFTKTARTTDQTAPTNNLHGQRIYIAIILNNSKLQIPLVR